MTNTPFADLTDEEAATVRAAARALLDEQKMTIGDPLRPQQTPRQPFCDADDPNQRFRATLIEGRLYAHHATGMTWCRDDGTKAQIVGENLATYLRTVTVERNRGTKNDAGQLEWERVAYPMFRVEELDADDNVIEVQISETKVRRSGNAMSAVAVARAAAGTVNTARGDK